MTQKELEALSLPEIENILISKAHTFRATMREYQERQRKLAEERNELVNELSKLKERQARVQKDMTILSDTYKDDIAPLHIEKNRRAIEQLKQQNEEGTL